MVVGLIAGGPTALTRAVEGAEDDRDRGREEIRSIAAGPDDLVVGIATSGRTPYVLGAVEEARTRGAFTVGLACNRPSLLGDLVDLEIAPLVGPEVLAGSTRLKAGTATKLVLNMMTTGAMVRIGKTMGNRMVDLQPTNEKLRIRSRRMLRELCGISDDHAVDLLARCSGNLKQALVVALAGIAPDRAARLLNRHEGQVRAAVRDATKAGILTNDDCPCLLGVDGGGTSTTAWLADGEGRVLGRGQAGPSNIKAIALLRRRAEEPASTGRSCSPSTTPDSRSVPWRSPAWDWRGSTAPTIDDGSTTGRDGRAGPIGSSWSTTATSSSRPGPLRAGGSG